MTQQGIQERIKETLVLKRRKHWYQRFWGKVSIVFGCLFLVIVIYFIVRVVQVYQEMTNGASSGSSMSTDDQGKMTSSEFITNFKHDAIVDLLQNGKDPSKGPAAAKVVIVAFEDFQCQYCSQAQPFIKKLLITHGTDIRFIYKDFPLTTIHDRAQSAAEAAQCANEQNKFWEFHDALFADQSRLSEAYYRALAKELGLNITQFNECVNTGKYKQAIAEDLELGRTLGIRGTPTFFINGEFFMEGYDSMKESDITDTFVKAIEYIKKL